MLSRVRNLITLSVVLAVVFGASVALSPPAFANPPKSCDDGGLGVIPIWALSNSRYVSAELGDTGSNYGMLRARATADGPWEDYWICEYIDGTLDGNVAIMSSANNRFVSAEVEYSGSRNGELRARSTAVGPWEKFHFAEVNGNEHECSIQSLQNHKYVSAELGDTGSYHGMLRARASTVGPWEKFYFFNLVCANL